MKRSRSRWIALALLLLIGAVHYAVEPLASQYADPAKSQPRSVLRRPGHQGNLSVWTDCFPRPRKLTAIPLYLACLWGAAEDTLVAGCRIARGIETPLDLGLWQGVLLWVAHQFHRPVIGAIAAGALLWEFDDASRDKSLWVKRKANAYLVGC